MYSPNLNRYHKTEYNNNVKILMDITKIILYKNIYMHSNIKIFEYKKYDFIYCFNCTISSQEIFSYWWKASEIQQKGLRKFLSLSRWWLSKLIFTLSVNLLFRTKCCETDATLIMVTHSSVLFYVKHELTYVLH
jgi:hypothetical protein